MRKMMTFRTKTMKSAIAMGHHCGGPIDLGKANRTLARQNKFVHTRGPREYRKTTVIRALVG